MPLHPIASSALQVGLVQFRGMALGDNGGGPVTPNTTLIKETGAQAEIAWVHDDRSRCVRVFAGVSGCDLTHKPGSWQEWLRSRHL